MAVQDTVLPETTLTGGAVSVPRQAGPVDPPATVPSPVPAPPLVGRDRPLTTDERQFAIGLAVLALVLGTIIVGGLLLGQYVWS